VKGFFRAELCCIVHCLLLFFSSAGGGYSTARERDSGHLFPPTACVLKECPGSAIKVVNDCVCARSFLLRHALGRKMKKFSLRRCFHFVGENKKEAGNCVYTEPPDIHLALQECDIR
jgi:hypothetical protein